MLQNKHPLHIIAVANQHYKLFFAVVVLPWCRRNSHMVARYFYLSHLQQDSVPASCCCVRVVGSGNGCGVRAGGPDLDH